MSSLNTITSVVRRNRIKSVVCSVVCSGVDQAALDAKLDKAGSFIVEFACSDETSPLTTGQKISFPVARAGTLIAVYASLVTAQGSGNIFTVDINKNGTTVLSTKITIDNGETDSATALTQPVISVSAFAIRDVVTVEVDQIGNSTAKGLKGTMVFTPS